MAIETEAKMKVPDLDAVRRKLTEVRAARKGAELEINAFFDTDAGTLRAADKGLRLRTAKDLTTGSTRYIITMKGALQQGALKSREEIELTVDDPNATADLFQGLGFKRQLSFEKRRETWNFHDCEIALDEMPYLGTFVEIEGDEADVMAARKALGMDDLPLIQTGYISLLSKYLAEHGIKDREIRL